MIANEMKKKRNLSKKVVDKEKDEKRKLSKKNHK